MKIAMLSDGGWSTALSLLLHENGHEVVLWGPFPEYIETMRQTRSNPRYLSLAVIPDGIKLTADLAEAVLGAEIIVLALPSQYMRGMLEKLVNVPRAANAVYVDVAKGIEVGSLKRMSEVVEEILGNVPYCVLTGPSHAEEVARRKATVVVVASKTPDAAVRTQLAFMNAYFRVYTSDDVVGAELGGALKNVIALAAGACDGMDLGDNTKAALMTRGITEIARMGVALGGRQETFSGLSGMGDLIVTCMSRHSRNRHVGEELGRGRPLAEIQREMHGMVAEGVITAKSAYLLASRIGVEVPIIEKIYRCIYESENPHDALCNLMLRDPKSEQFM
jgi:glycerol-3-phosphate dehydrogenase (NAD(P)+)